MWKVPLTVLCLFSICCEVRTQENVDNFNPNDVDNSVLEVFNNCKCVRYTQCDPNGFIITNGANLIDQRGDDITSTNSTRPKCKGGIFEGQYICCLVPGSDSLNSIFTSGSRENTSPTPPTRITIGKKGCGMQKTIIDTRVFVGEDELTPMDGEFPWIVAIYKKQRSGNYKFHCSGSLIAANVILTSNHYVHKKEASQFKVILNGKIELAAMGNNPKDEREIIEIVNHPQYYSGPLFYDAALLILNKPFESTPENFINRICLPPDNINLDGVRCLVAGWGKGSESQGAKVIRKVELPFINFTTCERLLRLTRLGPSFDLHRSFMCAGGEKGKDACKGDGGSPLMCPKPGTYSYYIAGIVSWGIGCGTENVPGVYTDVQQVKGWIMKELLERQISFDLPFD